MAKFRRIFPGGNTSSGFYSFHDNMIGENRNMLYILKGMPGGGKSSMMKRIGKNAIEEGYSVEYHHCPSDPDSIDGLVINELKIGIIDGTAPHIVDPVYPGVKDKLINLAQFIDTEKLKDKEEEIIKAKTNNKKAYFRTFSYLKSAKNIYNIIVENNKLGVDFEKVNKEAISLIDEILSKETVDIEDTNFKERHLFSSANTPSGFVDYTDTILEGIENIYYIEGEIGTGKSTLIKKVIDECKIREYSMEIYHNSTIPEKVESLIIKDLNVCITSNKNGFNFPHRKINLNKYLNDKVKNKDDYEVYQLLLEKATSSLAQATKNHQILEDLYNPTIDYSGIDNIRNKLLDEILQIKK